MQVGSVVFLSLVLDLFAFTIPLPLFPRIIEWYTKRESSDPHGFLSRTLAAVSDVRSVFYTPSHNSEKWDVVLLGGLMGSLFSALQFLVSPYIGSLSDTYGRKRILLLTMVGNILSAVVWIQSTTFASYMLSRVIGGLSEGNVQLAIAILSDVSTPSTRSRALASIGIAFALCFCIGPPIGAYFAAKPIAAPLSLELNVYALPALISLVLLLVETAFLAAFLPETKGTRVHDDKKAEGDTAKTAPKASPQARLALLSTLRHTHFLFLAVFSGVEFTLTFLTYDLLDWDNRRNGTLLATIGVLSALLQGGYVRRALARVGEPAMARRGVAACALSFLLLALLPAFTASASTAVRVLYAAAALLAFTSATVVNSLTAHASLLTSDEGEGEEHRDLVKGRALGRFRSSGQLGRALGPLLACASYWTYGPSITYAVSAGAMVILAASMRSLTQNTLKSKQA